MDAFSALARSALDSALDGRAGTPPSTAAGTIDARELRLLVLALLDRFLSTRGRRAASGLSERVGEPDDSDGAVELVEASGISTGAERSMGRGGKAADVDDRWCRPGRLASARLAIESVAVEGSYIECERFAARAAGAAWTDVRGKGGCDGGADFSASASVSDSAEGEAEMTVERRRDVLCGTAPGRRLGGLTGLGVALGAPPNSVPNRPRFLAGAAASSSGIPEGVGGVAGAVSSAGAGTSTAGGVQAAEASDVLFALGLGGPTTPTGTLDLVGLSGSGAILALGEAAGEALTEAAGDANADVAGVRRSTGWGWGPIESWP